MLGRRLVMVMAVLRPSMNCDIVMALWVALPMLADKSQTGFWGCRKPLLSSCWSLRWLSLATLGVIAKLESSAFLLGCVFVPCTTRAYP